MIDNPDLSYVFIKEALLAKGELESGELTPCLRKKNRPLDS